jgi:hypothetical protein
MMFRESLTPFIDVIGSGAIPNAGNAGLQSKALATLAAGSMYLQFYAEDSVFERMVYVYPDPSNGDPQLFIPIQPASGGVSLGITY